MYENVLLGAEHRADRAGLPRRGRRSAAAAQAYAALARLEIGHLARRHPDELSYGTRRRVEIARALAGSPTLLLLDEPLAGMNRSERVELTGILRRLGDEGITQVVIEHDLPLVTALSDRMVAMEAGSVLVTGTPAQVRSDPGVLASYLAASADVVERSGRMGALAALLEHDPDERT